jgi:nucleotide-sensitive chloride channel 1A
MAILHDNVSVPATDSIKLSSPNTMAFLDETNLGTGDLYVTEDLLIWRQAAGKGICLEYPRIALHAVSRDLTAFPHECIYMIVDKGEL